MGLYKLCTHKGRARDRCSHPWWGSFQYKGSLHRASLSRWADEKIRTKSEAEIVLERMKDAVRDGRFDEEPTHVVTFEAFAGLYLERYVRSERPGSARYSNGFASGEQPAVAR